MATAITSQTTSLAWTKAVEGVEQWAAVSQIPEITASRGQTK